MNLANETFNLIANVAFFLFFPLIWYLIKEKKIKGFFRDLGVFKPKNINVFKIFVMILTVYAITLLANLAVIYSGYSMRDNTIFQNTGFISQFLIIILFGLKTGIGEEIFFRGFIAKKCFAKLGFIKGNILQAVIFASVHFVISGSASYVDIIVRIINAFVLGYIFGYVVEKKSNGSIIPVIIAHSLINITSSLIFLLVF